MNEKLKSQQELDTKLLNILAKADDDVKYGRIAPIQDTFLHLRNLLSMKSA